MKKNGSKTTAVETTAILLDSYTPPGAERARGDANTARYLITEYDTPIDPACEEHTEFLLALLCAAKLLRREAMKWRDDIDWCGTSRRVSETDIEDRFTKAENCDREAKLLLDEYRRGARREWIAAFPRRGPQYGPQVYASWKRHERQEARKAARS